MKLSEWITNVLPPKNNQLLNIINFKHNFTTKTLLIETSEFVVGIIIWENHSTIPRHSALLAYTWFHCFRIYSTQKKTTKFFSIVNKITNMEPKLIFFGHKTHKIQCTYVCRHIIDDHYVRFVFCFYSLILLILSSI